MRHLYILVFISSPDFFKYVQKRVSGTYNALYIGRGALYTKMTQSFIYLETMLSIGEKYENKNINTPYKIK